MVPSLGRRLQDGACLRCPFLQGAVHRMAGDALFENTPTVVCRQDVADRWVPAQHSTYLVFPDQSQHRGVDGVDDSSPPQPAVIPVLWRHLLPENPLKLLQLLIDGPVNHGIYLLLRLDFRALG